MRFEYKYLVRNSDLENIRKEMLPYLNVDAYAESDKEINEYTVRSIYYDTAELEYYHEKIEGLKVRKKLRIRGYNNYDEKNVVFLEIKRKYERFIGKNRSPLKYHNLPHLLKSGDLKKHIITDNGFADSVEDGERFMHHMNRSSLKPTVLVVYNREAYFSKFNPALRITFDKNLRYLPFPKLENLYEEEELVWAMRNHFVLELKFYNGFPSWLSQIVTKYNLSREAISKYGICLESQKFLRSAHRLTTLPFTEAFDYDRLNEMEDVY